MRTNILPFAAQRLMAVPEGFQRQGRKLFFTLLPLLMASMPDAVKVILGGPLDTAELLMLSEKLQGIADTLAREAADPITEYYGNLGQ